MAKLAYAQWPWGTNSKEEFIQSCKDLSSLGYRYFESVRAFIDTFHDDPASFKAITEEYDLHPISFYFHLSGEYAQDVDTLKKNIAFVADQGIKTICVQGKWSKEKTTPEVLQETLRTINEYGKICKDYGILPSVHPHTNTSVMYESEIDFIMNNTDPALIGFAPDTAHIYAASCDPVKIIDRYKERVSFTHIKDVRGPMASEGMQDGVEVYSSFLELGTGDVDLDGIFKVLQGVNYGGYLCVELDRAPVSNLESAANNMKYMKAHWSGL